MIIKPNEVDSSGLNINAKNILEFPPIYTGELSYWGEEWTGNYKKSENLINFPFEFFSLPACWSNSGATFFFMCFCRL